MAEGPVTPEQERLRPALARTRLVQALLKPMWVLLGIYTGIAGLAAVILLYSAYDWLSSAWFFWWVWSGSFAAVLTAVLGATHLLINRFVDLLGLREADEPPVIDHYS
jgi:hypothetical protein